MIFDKKNRKADKITFLSILSFSSLVDVVEAGGYF
jgi:hypothetical protein